MTFRLGMLGPYRVERTEEYIPWGSDNSYAEMIRVRRSRANPPVFMVPSHLYKYSETEMGLYLKDHKNLWRPLGRILNERIDISDAELMIHFPIARFADIARIVPFVRKAVRKVPLTEEEKQNMVARMMHGRLLASGESDFNAPKTGGRIGEG
jgi:hypothetical protein